MASRNRSMASRQMASARVVHRLLYALLFVVPLLGWINASWRGFAVVMFGVEFPKLIATRAPGWAWTGDLHSVLANYVMLGLVGLHVAAVIYHQFVRRDRILDRMQLGG
jgi:cytochrome b561